MTVPTLRPLGDAGVVAEFGGDEISDAANAAVLALRQVIEAERPPGVVEAIPTYRSLLVVFDPLRTTAAAVRQDILGAASRADPSHLPAGRLVEIATAYGGVHGPDLAPLAAEVGLSEQDVIAAHASHEYRVYMLGFSPGFPYMGILPEALRVPRLRSPRTYVPERTVALAGQQTGVYPIATPGGWRLIGRTPLRIYDPAREAPFLLDAGDRVRFVAIGPDEYERRAPRDGPPPAPPRAAAPDLVVERGGLWTTVQDLGRPGYRHFGLPQSGAMDPLSLRIANLLLGNPPGAAALELTAPGPRLVVARRTAIAVTGADLSPSVNGRPVAGWSALSMREGDVLEFGAPRSGQWAYVAVPGGIDVPPALGSRATYARAALGGYGGRRLADGDALACGRRAPGALLRLADETRPSVGGARTVRIVLGPQESYFAEAAVAALLDEEFSPGVHADRVGYRLDGARLEHRSAAELLSDGLLPGAIQVPAGGQPIVIMADGPTAGGYPKIAAVARADLRLVAQARRGDPVRFRAVAWDEAHLAAREAAAAAASLRFERVGE
ncbi:MAG TPA: 5-oxoprolinase subunit PxpB [bacterium]|nr:5-oxoprolinase subunit PxpB [bacterium]